MMKVKVGVFVVVLECIMLKAAADILQSTTSVMNLCLN